MRALVKVDPCKSSSMTVDCSEFISGLTIPPVDWSHAVTEKELIVALREHDWHDWRPQPRNPPAIPV